MKCEFKLILCLHTETCHRDQKGRVSIDLLEMTKANCKHCIVREEKLKPFLTTPTSNQGLLGAGSHGVRILGRKGEMLTSKRGRIRMLGLEQFHQSSCRLQSTARLKAGALYRATPQLGCQLTNGHLRRPPPKNKTQQKPKTS